MKMRHIITIRLCVVVSLLVLLSMQANAAEWTFVGPNNTTWDNAAAWSPTNVPANANTTDIVFSNMVSVLKAGGSSPTQRSVTYLAEHDGLFTIILSNSKNSTAAGRRMTFSSDSGNATLTVEAGSTGNKVIRRDVSLTSGDLGRIILTDTLDVMHDGSGEVRLGNGNQAGTSYGVRIDGAGGINKYGSGLLRFDGRNIYTGDTVMYEGTLQLNHVNAIEDSTLNTGTSGVQVVTFLVSGTNTYNFGGLKGDDDLAIGVNTISVGSNGDDTTFSGVLSGVGGGVTKTGTGALTFSGVNTYSGDTVVSNGTLNLATGVVNNAEMRFVVGAPGVNSSLSGSGTVNLDGTFRFDLTGASSIELDEWQIMDVNNLTETFGSTFACKSTLGSFVEISAGKWRINENGVAYDFIEASGLLYVPVVSTSIMVQ